jgi:CheY-like chemotaxis protein
VDSLSGCAKPSSHGETFGAKIVCGILYHQTRAAGAVTTQKKDQVLLIDDNPDLLHVVSRQLEAGDWEVVAASSAREALEKLKQAMPRVILLDMYMPGIDGFQLARFLKNDPDHHHIPIVAITASGLPSERERCMRAGCDDWLPKPFHLQELKRLLANYAAPK